LQYMKAMLDVYQNAYRAMPNPLNPFDFMQKSSPSGEEKHDSGKRTSKTRKSSEAPVAEPENVEELRNRVADLEKLVSKLAGASKTRRRNWQVLGGSSPHWNLDRITAIGAAIGTSSHGIGTASLVRHLDMQAAASSWAMAAAGVFTSVLASLLALMMR
jgi:hypothetical protein